MAASDTTTHYQLPIYQPDDITSWLTDWNGAMQKIDEAIYEAAQSGGGGQPTINVVQTTGASTTDVMSQNAVTQALASKANTTDIPAVPNVVQNTGDSETDVMSQAAVTAALAGAGGGSVSGYKFTGAGGKITTSGIVETITETVPFTGKALVIYSTQIAITQTSAGEQNTADTYAIIGDQNIPVPFLLTGNAPTTGGTKIGTNIDIMQVTTGDTIKFSANMTLNTNNIQYVQPRLILIPLSD